VGQAATLTTNMTPAQKTKYLDRFLSHYKEVIVAEQFGQTVTVEHGAGKTVDFFRYHPLAKVTSAGTEGDTGAYTYKALLSMNITATLTEWMDQVSFSMLHWATSRDRHLAAGVDTVTQQAAESIDREIIHQLVEHGIWPIPANAVSSLGVIDADYYAEGVKCDSVVTATPTTVVHLDETTFDGNMLSDNTQSLVGGWACISRGRGYGHCSRISAFESAENAMTLTNAAPETMESAGNTTPTEFTLMGPFHASTALTSSHKITTELLNKGAEVLRKNGAKKFPNGRYACLITPEIHRQLLSDKRWRETAIHSPAAADGGHKNGLVATWADMDFFIHTSRPKYVGTAATINSMSEGGAGRLMFTLCLGMDAFGVVGLEGMGAPRLSFKIPTPDDGNTSNPNNTYGTIGWYRAWITKSLNANFCVGLLSYV
jgi:hypothetical protein